MKIRKLRTKSFITLPPGVRSREGDDPEQVVPPSVLQLSPVFPPLGPVVGDGGAEL
jgi:hypothetical protein